jgi:hypothetical protein
MELRGAAMKQKVVQSSRFWLAAVLAATAAAMTVCSPSSAEAAGGSAADDLPDLPLTSGEPACLVRCCAAAHEARMLSLLGAGAAFHC